MEKSQKILDNNIFFDKKTPGRKTLANIIVKKDNAVGKEDPPLVDYPLASKYFNFIHLGSKTSLG